MSADAGLSLFFLVVFALAAWAERRAE